MRKIFNLFAATIISLVAVSCDKEEHLPNNQKDIILHASISNSSTRTSLGNKDNNQYPVLWTSGDQIAVVQGDAIFKFDLIGGDGTTTGTFKLDRNSSVEVEFSENESYTAIYPYSAIKKNGNLIYEAPAIQQYVNNSFKAGVSPMYAYNGSALGMTFSNIFSILKLNIKGVAGEKVQKIQVGSNMPLAGDVQLGSSAFTYQNSAYNITLNCGAGVDISQAEDFVIVIPPHSAIQLAIVITTDKGSYYKAATSDVEMTAGNILSMREIDLGGEGSAQRSLMSINYPEDNKNGVFIGTKVWANVNCGYDAGHPYGLLYQWGRKYGQGYGSETPAVVNIYGNENGNNPPKGPLSSAEEGSSEDLKNNFYYGVDDWLTTQVNTLWNINTADNKEVYPTKNYSCDPCPAGWRVPTMSELEGLSVKKSDWTQNNNQSGYWFSGNVEYSNDAVAVFFPAAGYRHYWDNDTGVERGNKGRYVSSTATETDGWVCAASLVFESNMIESSSLRKAFGFSVRCVKDQTNLPASDAGTGGYANGGNDLEW